MDKENIYLVLPGCDDTNRGDQALIWETVQLSREAGFQGKYFMIASTEKSRQSKQEGIGNIDYILPHPSTHFKKNNNIQYGKILKMKWVFVSIIDGTKALIILTRPGRFFAKRFGKKELKRSLHIFENAKAALVKGGGFIHSYGGLTSTYAIFYDLYHVLLAESMKIPVYVMPNSYGPFIGPGSGRLVSKILSKCRMVTARESISQNMLYSATGIKADLLPDLAFYLEADSRMTKKQAQKLEMLPLEKERCVAITMRPYRFPKSKNPVEKYKGYKETLCKMIKWLDGKGYFPIIIEHTYSDTEHERDISCIKEVTSLLGNTCRYMVYSDLTLNSRQLKYVYSKFDYIIGTRFHSVIFSIASGVPAIAITYGGNKGQGIMRDIGVDEYSLEIEELSFKALSLMFEKLEANTVQVKEQIQTYLNRLPKEREKLLGYLRK